MNVVVVPATQIVSLTHDLKVDEVPAIAGEVVHAIFGAAKRLSLTPAGPLIFIYYGFTSPDKSFKLEFALPAGGRPSAASDAQSGAIVRTASAFRCVTRTHVGSMSTLIESWTSLYGAVSESGFSLTPETREVFTKFVGFESAANITEIQIGIQ